MTRVHQDQRSFRSLLAAMSRPGIPQRLPDADTFPFGSLGLVLSCLLDSATSICLWPGLDKELENWVAGLNARRASNLPADFVLARAADWDWSALDDLPQGSEEAPENSATLLCWALRGPGQDYVLQGPGINGQLTTWLPLAPSFLMAWERNHARYPQGVDVILLLPDACIGLPRSTQIGLP